jgi:DNA-binding GntR family transcriptional regulator
MRSDHVSGASSEEAISRGNLRQQVCSKILSAVFQGRFRSGERLIVHHLSELYGVSPTPVRESLVELASFGIVDLLPNRGAIVRPFRSQEVREISQIRRILEVEATRCACGRIDADPLSYLESELVRLQETAPSPSWSQRARATDSKLHGLIAASCGSARLTNEIGRYVTLWRTLRNVSQSRDAPAKDANVLAAVSEHLEIVRALLMPRAEEAACRMDRHIRSSGRQLEEVLFGGKDSGVAPKFANEKPVPSPGLPEVAT